MHGLAILSFLKKTKIWNCPLGGAFAHSFKALGGVTGVFLSHVLIPHFSQPLPNQFSCLSQNTLWKEQESPQNEIRD